MLKYRIFSEMVKSFVDEIKSFVRDLNISCSLV